jgi:type VI secretion system secreted protein Hcp
MATSNVYLKVDNVTGEAVDTDHQSWIEVDNFSWGLSNPASFAINKGGQATQANFGPLVISKHTDQASSALAMICANGGHPGKATLSCMKLDGTSRVEYLKIELENVMVTDFQWGGSGGDQIVNETCSLIFNKITTTYQVQQDAGGAGGAATFSYDISTSDQSSS